jgi:myo-inositol-1(or 4)-monophosphatase
MISSNNTQRYGLNTPLINVMTAAALKTTRHLLRDFGEIDNLQVSRKGAMDFVTVTDKKVEKLLFEHLQRARPDFGFLMEEAGEVKGESEFRWVIDPLDGTTNFMHAVPYFCVSIGVEKRTDAGSELIAGVVYDPVHDEMFMAEAGKGAYLNQRKITVSKRESDFYFVTGTSRRRGQHSKECSELADYADGLDAVIRRSGAAALDLAYVACGRYDAAWFPKLKEWDMAAGMLLVKEAGGLMCLPDGTNGNPYAHLCIFAGSYHAHRVMMHRSRTS